MKGTLTIERVSWLSASLVVSVFLLLSASQVQAANISSATDGKWSEPTTWASVAKTGKITFSDDSLNVLGVDTLFTSELQVGSLLRVTVSRGVVFMTVATIVDNTHLTVSQLPTFDSGAAKNFTASTVPKAGDEVTISSGDQVLVEGEVAVNSLSFPSNNNGTSSLSLANGATMIVSGFVVIPRASSPAFNILNVGDGQLSAGSIAFTNGGTQAAKRHQLWIGNGLLSVGNVIQSASSGSALIEFKGAGKLKVAGEFLNKDNATLVPGLGTIEYGGEAVQTIGQFDYYNLTLSGLLVKQFVTGTKIEGELTIAPSGSAVAKLVVGQTIQTKTLILGGVARKSGIWGASDSTATYKDNNYFAPGNGLLMVASSGSSVAQVTNWPTASAITYGQELSASLLTGGSATVGGTFVWQDGGLKPDEVGVSNQTVIFRPNDTGAYDDLTAEVSVQVKPSSVLPVITVEDKIYDASQQATISSCQVVALAGDELGCSVNGASFADANVGDNKNVNLGLVLLTGADAAKYVIDDNEVGLQADIKKRPISIKAESRSKLVGEADPLLTYVIMSGNLVGADQWSGGLTRMSGEELGSYEIRLGDLKISDNYELQFVGANLVISEQAVVEVLADSQAIIYGQTPASLTFKYVGLVEGDSEAGIDVAPVCNIVGDYTTVGVYPIVCAGAVDDSYDFSYKSGTLTVLKAVAGLNISNLEQGYNGQSRSVDVVTDPAGLAVEVLYDGLVMAPNLPLLTGIVVLLYLKKVIGILPK
jgi:hypothetical protein